mgnify:CR=1 FL=1
MAIDPNPPAQLSPPPKFQSQSNPIIGPQTPDEWAQFWRWLYSQYLTVKYIAGHSTPPNTFPSSFPPQQPDNLPGQFPVFPPQLPDPGDVLALVTGFRAAASVLRETPEIPQGFPPVPYNTRQPIEILVCTQATFPTLTSGSIPVFIFVTDYVHMLYWDGTTSVFCGDQSGLIHWAESNPGTGYQLCDGSTVNRLNADGTVTSVTVPDATTAWFLEGGLVNSGPTAAVAPTFAGTPATLTGTVSAPTLSINNFTPVGTVAGPIFTGTAAVIATNTFTPIALATAAMITLDGSSTSYTPDGTNSAPAFTGTAGAVTGTASVPALTMNSYTPAGTVSATGEPRKVIRRPYYRR